MSHPLRTVWPSFRPSPCSKGRSTPRRRPSRPRPWVFRAGGDHRPQTALYGSCLFPTAARAEGGAADRRAMLGVGAAPGPGPSNAPAVHDWIALLCAGCRVRGYAISCALVSRRISTGPVGGSAPCHARHAGRADHGVIALDRRRGGGDRRACSPRIRPTLRWPMSDRLAGHLFPTGFYGEICRRLDPVEGKRSRSCSTRPMTANLPLVGTNPTALPSRNFTRRMT